MTLDFHTCITDVEIIETRYPVRIERFAIRRSSGGAGQHPGGDGIVCETILLVPMSLSVLTQHRTTGPYGVADGGEGQSGRQRVVRADGSTAARCSVNGAEIKSGDRLVLETPGSVVWGSGIAPAVS